MKKIISLMLIILSCFMLIGCHKTTEDEKSVIECLENIEKDIDKAIDSKTDSKLETYNKIEEDIKNCSVLNSISNSKVNKTDEYVKENNLECERKVLNSIYEAQGKLSVSTYKEDNFKDAKSKIKDVLDQYKKDIKNRD